MTGTDPAILAAQRAWESEGWGGPGRPLEEGMSEGRLAVAAVREAFASIRELHKPKTIPWPYFRRYDSPTHITGCDHCNGQWPCDTARLIYTSEELNHD